jgi:predicted component of type VI protein secretion system
MSTAGAPALREDDNGMSREAVLLQWERKIEDAERRESGRFERAVDGDADGPLAEPVPLRPDEDATSPRSRRFERRTPPAPPTEAPASPAPGSAAVAERRTIQIAGQPTQPRRRRSVVEAQMAQPDRIALWAFLLGLFLVAVAAGTAHT